MILISNQAYGNDGSVQRKGLLFPIGKMAIIFSAYGDSKNIFQK